MNYLIWEIFLWFRKWFKDRQMVIYLWAIFDWNHFFAHHKFMKNGNFHSKRELTRFSLSLVEKIPMMRINSHLHNISFFQYSFCRFVQYRWGVKDILSNSYTNISHLTSMKLVIPLQITLNCSGRHLKLKSKCRRWNDLDFIK